MLRVSEPPERLTRSDSGVFARSEEGGPRS